MKINVFVIYGFFVALVLIVPSITLAAIRISLGPNGEQLWGDNIVQSITSDGTKVLFRKSYPTALFLRDTVASTTQEVIRDSLLAGAVMSADGNVVVYRLVNGGAVGIYAYDMTTHQTELIAANSVYMPTISADGTYVAYVSSNYKTVMGYDRTTHTEEVLFTATNGCDSLVMTPDAKEFFFNTDYNTWVYNRDTHFTSRAVPGNTVTNPGPVAVSGDGRYLTFAAWEWINGSQQKSLYYYDRTSQVLERIGATNQWPTMSADGRFVAYPANTALKLFDHQTASTTTLFNDSNWYVNPAPISGDGRYIFLNNTPTPLIPEDTNGTGDVYRLDNSFLSAGPVACTPGTEGCNSNVMFLPGLMGSRLYDAQGNELWVSSRFLGGDAKQAELALSTQGTSINDIHTKDDTHNAGESDETGIVDDVYGSNIYESFVKNLKDWKAEGTIKDYAFIPYDWRLSLDDIITNGATSSDNLSYGTPQSFEESYILKQLQQLQKSSKTGKVTIVAHSNGGLVAKALIQKLKETNNPLYDKIDKVILVAVPQVGTPDAVAGVLHGSELGWLGSVMSKARSRQLAENMPAVYNLLPSAGYFSTVNTSSEPLVTFENVPAFSSQIAEYGTAVTTEGELSGYVLGSDGRSKPAYDTTVSPNKGNPLLYAKAQLAHEMLDNWQPASSTKVVQVAGWGEETLAGIDYTQVASLGNTTITTYDLRHVIDGDGTVVTPSALWMSDAAPNVERWWVNLDAYDTLTTIGRVHRDILEVPSLRSFLKSQISNSTFNDPDHYVVNNTSTLVPTGQRLHFTLHSPLTLGITDSSGRYTGLDPVTGEIKEEIPNTSYKQYGEVQFLSVPAGLQYTLKLKGYETGTFALDVEKQTGNTVSESTSFQGVPTATTTEVAMDITPTFAVASSTLTIDQNGDGATDATLEASPKGVTLYDLTAPVTTATPQGPVGLHDYYTSAVTVILSSEDSAPDGEVSSGVATTKYSLDGGTTWNTYSTTTPIIIATEGSTTLAYYSVDTNGNREITKTLTLNIDTTPPTIFASDTSAEQLTESGTLLTIPATVEDSIDANPTLATDIPLTQTFAPGVTTIHLTATDSAGNIATSSIAVTVYSSPTADPDGDGVPNLDDVKPFDAAVFAGLTIPNEYSLWEKESFDLPLSVAGKGNVTLSLSSTYYQVGASPVKDSAGTAVPATVTTTDGITIISFPQATKDLKTYTLTLTTKKGNTKERETLKKKIDTETNQERKHELEEELDFVSAPITLKLTNPSANKTTSQTATVNIYDKEQNAQIQYKYKDTDHSTTLTLKSDDLIKLKKGQPLVFSVKVTGIKKDVPFSANITGNFTMLNVVQEEEHRDNDDRKQKAFTLFYPTSATTDQETITVNLTVGGITTSDAVRVRFEE